MNAAPLSHLLQFGESEGVAVLGSELHEPHVGRVRELSDDAEAGEQSVRRGEGGYEPLAFAITRPLFLVMVIPEHGLDVDDGLGVCHVVLLGAHGALFVHDHQVVGVDDTALQQVVQAAPRKHNNTRRW